MIKEFLLGLLLNGIRIEKKDIIAHINEMDADNDGAISLKELVLYAQSRLHH